MVFNTKKLSWFSSIQLFIGLAQAVAAITTSAFSCRTVCCRKRSNAGTVIFAPVNAGGADARFVSLTLNTSSNAPATEVTGDKPSETNFSTQINGNDDPPGYQEITLHSSDDQSNNHLKYQRLDWSLKENQTNQGNLLINYHYFCHQSLKCTVTIQQNKSSFTLLRTKIDPFDEEGVDQRNFIGT